LSSYDAALSRFVEDVGREFNGFRRGMPHALLDVKPTVLRKNEMKSNLKRLFALSLAFALGLMLATHAFG